MPEKYFLSANSSAGFYSLYNAFPPEGAFCHIIKGGPGTGKSSFMRLAAERAREKGLSVEYVLCSGDPSSLDGIYIPELRVAFKDGTAPHTAEPGIFGVDSDYVNLGRFCKTPLSPADRSEAEILGKISKENYSRAYELLSYAGRAHRAEVPEATGDAGELVNSLCGDTGERRTLFLSAITRDGRTELYSDAISEYEHVYTANTLDNIINKLRNEQIGHIQCLSPLCPEDTEAVLIPSSSCAVLKVGRGFCALGGEAQGEEHKLIQRAVEHIKTAGHAHDALEKVIRRYMDFDALSEFEESYIESVFVIM